MSSFKDVAQQFDVPSIYEGGIKVFVESNDDLAIFRDKWFFEYKDTISFESASDGQGDGDGGCSRVVALVNDFDEDARTAYGIVDRDILLHDDHREYRDTLWWETDDDTFHQAKPFGEQIHILRRWELENYLLKPQAIATWLKDKLCSPHEQQCSADDLLRDEDDLINISCLNILAIENDKSAPGEKFGRGKHGAELQKDILNHLDVATDKLDAHSSKIKAFAEDEEELANRWDKLSRLLDGKRVMHRLSDKLRNNIDPKNKGLDLYVDRAFLAEFIKNGNLIDRELHEMIQRFAA